jgi:hypothetical protein
VLKFGNFPCKVQEAEDFQRVSTPGSENQKCAKNEASNKVTSQEQKFRRLEEFSVEENIGQIDRNMSKVVRRLGLVVDFHQLFSMAEANFRPGAGQIAKRNPADPDRGPYLAMSFISFIIVVSCSARK